MMKKFFNNKLLSIILLSIVAAALNIIVMIQAIEIIRNKIGVISEVEWYPSKLDNVIITINKKEFKSGDTLEFTIINLSEKTYGTGACPDKIEFLRYDGKWVDAKWLFSGVCIAILYLIPPGGHFTQAIKLFPVYEGTYRVSQGLGSGSTTYTFFIYFKVTEGTPKEDLPRANLPEHVWEEIYKFCSIDEKTDEKIVHEKLSGLVKSDYIFVSLGIKGVTFIVFYATESLLEKFPKQCRGVNVAVEIESWALDEPAALEEYKPASPPK